MCELFAVCAARPTRVSLTMRKLAERGAPGGKLADGWGVACYDGADARLLREPEPAGASPWLDGILAAGRPNSRMVIAHIRQATQGTISLANTQPFARELGGRMHIFAHNGMLRGIEQELGVGLRRFRPVGQTDSEVAFCALLERMAPLWAEGAPGVRQRLETVARFAEELRPLGPANFLYADGDALFAHGHRRTQSDGQIRPPGLTMRVRREARAREDLAEAGVTLEPESVAAPMVLFASVPLSDEPWTPLGEGEAIAVRDGEIVG